MVNETEIRARYDAAGQGHVFQYVDQASADEKSAFLEQLDGIKVEEIADLLKATREETSKEDTGVIKPFTGPIGRTSDKECVEESYTTGMKAIQEGKVAALVLAGGQGTRLGFDGPKGMYDVGLPSGKTLFQLMAERIVKLTQLAEGDSVTIPFYIMTSPINHRQTVEFWESKNYFGLGKDNVIFFQQGMLPCMKDDGKIILEAAACVAMAPDGNGGIYPSLQQSGALDGMVAKGIKYVHVFSIDNALVRPADPVFIGYCVDQNADCGNKVVWKAGAHEKVGVVATKDDKPCIVEYSEITKEMAEATDDQGRLQFGAGNICNHFYTVDFIKDKVIPNMGNMYHIARKKIKSFDGKETVSPTENSGIKLETFIFDVFSLSERHAVLDVERASEFGPVKNKPGSPSDSPDTARALLSAQAKKWAKDAGAKLSNEEAEDISEVSPLTSYGGEGLEDHFKGRKVTCPIRV